MPKLIKYKEISANKPNPKTEELFIKCVNTYYKLFRNNPPSDILVFNNCIKFVLNQEDGFYFTFEALKAFVSTAAKLKPIISDGDVVFYLPNLDFEVCLSITKKHNLSYELYKGKGNYGE